MTNGAIRQPDHHRAARLAYRTLLAIGSPELPVDVPGIIRRVRNTRLMTYSQAGAQAGRSVYGMVGTLPSAQACTLRYEYQGIRLFIVLYNDDVCFGNQGSRRWSLAHELGHIILGHDRDDSVCEREANSFAQHLICPRPILEALPPPDLDLLCVAFGMSRAAARIALGHGARPCPLVDQDMRMAVRALYGVAQGVRWQDLMHPVQQAAYGVRRRRG